MKLTKAVGYNIDSQQEIEANFLLDETQISEIVNSFFDEMEYAEIRKWIWENIPEPNAVLVDIGTTGEQPPFVYEKNQE